MGLRRGLTPIDAKGVYASILEDLDSPSMYNIELDIRDRYARAHKVIMGTASQTQILHSMNSVITRGDTEVSS